MKAFLYLLFIVVSSSATMDSLRIAAPLPDSVLKEIQKKQKIEKLNTQIEKMKKISECDKIKKASAKEKMYCRTRFQTLHPEIEEE